LGTKDHREAKRLADEVLTRFRKTLDKAETLLVDRPIHATLAQSEIDRIAEYHFATVLSSDDEATNEAPKSEDFACSIAAQLTAAEVEYTAPVPFDLQPTACGLTNRQVAKRSAELEWLLPITRDALSRGLSASSDLLYGLAFRVGEHGVDRHVLRALVCRAKSQHGGFA
jgi:hypothetical protein